MDGGAPGGERSSHLLRYARSPPVAGTIASPVGAEPPGSPPAPWRMLEASSSENSADGRSGPQGAPANGAGPAAPARPASAIMTAKAGYGLLSAASGVFSLFMGTLGETGYFVLFGGISLYFLRRVAGLRKVRAGRVSDGDGLRDYKKGGFPLAVIAVASILLALSAASFAMSAAAVNDPDDGICDYDRTAATAVYLMTADDGTVTRQREYCDAHTGYFLAANPLHPRDLRPTSRAGVTYLDRPISHWAPVFSALWAAFVSFMIAASVTLPSPATRWESPFVICGLGRGILAMATGFSATLLFIPVSVGLAGLLLNGARPDWLLYGTMMVVFAAFLAAFFRRRGGAG